ncbi:type II toxin-antitoxin system mRNA interferase toxin, RelE/StbE family [Candidatus Parcubacteria bacterium]|nr:type II toxin-antitoxin system mRNA interferase toxin, RelE/StbE family [Candidatus Parcubacteria bacterium]
MIIYPTSRFRKSFKKLPSTIQKKAKLRDKIFRKDPFALNLQTHKLKGKLKDYWAYSVNDDYRVLFRFINEDSAIYFNIGTHEIYK